MPMARSAVGELTAVTTVAVLLAVFASASLAATVTELVISVGEAGLATVSVAVAELLTARVPKLQTSVPPLPLHDPVLPTTVTGLPPNNGRRSVAVTPVAWDGPKLVTVMV